MNASSASGRTSASPAGSAARSLFTLGLSDEFGHERILDTPISELGLTGITVGAAMAGLQPIADVQYADFLFLAMDQLANEAAKMTYMSGGAVKVPLVIRATVAAADRGAQHTEKPRGVLLPHPRPQGGGPGHGLRRQGVIEEHSARR